jgi:hypothetical protein
VVLYVGSTRRGLARIAQSLEERDLLEEDVKITIFPCLNESEARKLEAVKIKELNPHFNSERAKSEFEEGDFYPVEAELYRTLNLEWCKRELAKLQDVPKFSSCEEAIEVLGRISFLQKQLTRTLRVESRIQTS